MPRRGPRADGRRGRSLAAGAKRGGGAKRVSRRPIRGARVARNGQCALRLCGGRRVSGWRAEPWARIAHRDAGRGSQARAVRGPCQGSLARLAGLARASRGSRSSRLSPRCLLVCRAPRGKVDALRQPRRHASAAGGSRPAIRLSSICRARPTLRARLGKTLLPHRSMPVDLLFRRPPANHGRGRSVPRSATERHRISRPPRRSRSGCSRGLLRVVALPASPRAKSSTRCLSENPRCGPQRVLGGTAVVVRSPGDRSTRGPRFAGDHAAQRDFRQALQGGSTICRR